jgi:hypothetical protein
MMDWFWKGRKVMGVEGDEEVEEFEIVEEVEQLNLPDEGWGDEVIVLSCSSRIPFPTMIRCVLGYC